MTADDIQYFCWAILCLVAGCIMFIFHFYKIWQANGFRKQIRLSSILSLLLISLGIIGIIVFIVTMYMVPDHLFCVFSAHWGPSGYSIFKFILYTILILRFSRTFKGTQVQYNPTKLKLWILILALWTTANLIGINLTAQNVKGKCEVARPPLPMIASIALIDIVSCVTNTILFAKPLFELNKLNVTATSSAVDTSQLKYIALKQCMLSSIAIISTVASLLIVAMFNLYVISISFDYVINSLCIILMYKWNSVCIERTCFCCYHHVQSSPKTKVLDDIATNLEMTNNTDSKIEMPSQTVIQTNISVQSVSTTSARTSTVQLSEMDIVSI